MFTAALISHYIGEGAGVTDRRWLQIGGRAVRIASLTALWLELATCGSFERRPRGAATLQLVERFFSQTGNERLRLDAKRT